MSTQVNANPFFTPTQISGCQLWLDAVDPNGSGTPLANGTFLTSWKDKSTNGFTGTAFNFPVVRTNVLNSLPVIRFNGTNQYINFGNVLNLGTNPLAIFVVTRFDTTNETGIVGKTAYAAADQRWAVWYGKSGVGSSVTGVQNIYQDNAQSGNPTVSTNPATIGTQFNLYSYTTTRNFFTMLLNGTVTDSKTITGTPSNFLTSFNLLVAAYADAGGLSPRATMYLNGDIAEILVYFSNLTDSQRQQIEGYLAWKWGLQANLPTNHPYRNSIIPPLLNPPVTLPVAVQNTASTFNPTQISGCQLWLDGSDLTTLSLSGSTVTAWRDKSGNVNNIATNGSITYNSASNYVQTTGGSTYFTAPCDFRKTTTPNGSIFLVYKWLSYNTGTNQTLWGTDVGGGWNRFQALSFPSFTSIEYGISYGNTSPNTSNMPIMNTSNTLLYCVSFSMNTSNGSFGFINGAQQTSFTEVAASPQTNTTSIFFGQLGSGLYYSQSGFNEIIVYRSSITTAQRQQVEGYLAWKWGLQANLPTTHPYKVAPPFSARISGPSRSISSYSTWVPLQINNCALWLDGADRNSMVFSGLSVTQWNDKSTNAYKFIQQGSFATPVFVTNAFGSQSALSFTGNSIQVNSSNQILTNASFALNSSTAGYSIFTVAVQNTSRPSYTGYNYIISTYGGTTGTGIFYGTEPGGSLVTANGTLGPIYGFNDLNANVPNTVMTTTRLTGMVVDGNVLTPYLNGTAMSAKTGTCVALTGMSIGNAYAPTQAFTGQTWGGLICEIVIYNAALSTIQRQQLEGYLAWKWGLQGNLPITHPYKKWPPSP